MSVQAFFSSARRLQQLPVEYEVFCFSAEPCVSLEAPHNLYTALASLGGYRVFLFMFAWVSFPWQIRLKVLRQGLEMIGSINLPANLS